MLKHRKFPSRLTGSDFQFTIRRSAKGDIPKIWQRERFPDRKPSDRRADAGFVQALYNYFGEEPFMRGNLDAGRLSWLLGREVIAVDDPFDPQSYETFLKLNIPLIAANYPDALEPFDE